MTNEEQIMKLQTYKMHEDEDTVYVERDDVLKALELQSCEDCIRRQEVNELVDELARAISDERSFMSRGRSTSVIMEDILHLSSVKPQPEFYPPCQDCNTKMNEVRRAYDRCRWIPCSERLPETSGVYLVTGHFYNEPYEIWLCEFTDFEIVKGWCYPVSRPIVEYWMIAPELPKQEDNAWNGVNFRKIQLVLYIGMNLIQITSINYFLILRALVEEENHEED